jgi:hypothetical protein
MKGIGATGLLAAMLPLGLASTATADRLVEARTLFTGRNIYAPAVIDSAAPSPNPFAPLLNVFGRYAMWYGGWQSESDEPHDKIYRRVSQDNGTWSEPITVLTPAQLPGPPGFWQHVNDPSVTVTNRLKPYTMFLTACRNPCGIAEGNEIWSVESLDGITWTSPKPLLALPFHPAEPAALWERSGSQVWKVYFEDRADCQKIQVVSVNSRREAFDMRTVYSTDQFGACLLNPEVRHFEGAWHLIYNRSPEFNIEDAASQSNTFWSAHEVLIDSARIGYCATAAPGVLPAAGDQYDLYFGLALREPDGSCDITQFRRMERWRFRDDPSASPLTARSGTPAARRNTAP